MAMEMEMAMTMMMTMMTMMTMMMTNTSAYTLHLHHTGDLLESRSEISSICLCQLTTLCPDGMYL